SFDDRVFGRVTVEHQDLEDFVLLRSDGDPTYHLGVVADDIDMRVTHVIRGADHLSNTPKQILMYQALGASPPAFAHLPLILGPDRQRLSKRHGATSVGAYREQGVLPEAVKKFWEAPDLAEYLKALAERLARVEPFDLQETEKCLGAFGEERGVKAGLLIDAVRVALTGQAVAPGLFEVMVTLGRDRVVA